LEPGDWLRIAMGGRERERASERASGPDGGSPVLSTDAEKGAEEGGGFFPIKQPAEFVFSPKRRCRFKVIDCHREGGTDSEGGESNRAGGGRERVDGQEGEEGAREGGLKGDRRVRSGIGGQDVSVYREDRYEQRCRSFRSVSFRFASSPFRYVTLRLLGRASPRAI